MTAARVRALLDEARRTLFVPPPVPVAGRVAGGTPAMDSSDTRSIDAELLLTHVLHKSRAWLYAHGDDAVDAAAAQAFREHVARRAAGEPVAYLTGRREFWSLDLAVTPDVLIPRPETERLVELALQRIPRERTAHIADLGAGSGAVALALARERPRARVCAIDRSAAALAVARANAQRLAIGNVEFIESDWYAALHELRFDAIVSNPPYIARDDAHLTQGDLRFEPRAALVSGADGMDAIRKIVAGAQAHLNPGAWLLFEHGLDQGEAARDLLLRFGFQDVFSACDLEARERVSGGHRVDGAGGGA